MRAFLELNIRRYLAESDSDWSMFQLIRKIFLTMLVSAELIQDNWTVF